MLQSLKQMVWMTYLHIYLHAELYCQSNNCNLNYQLNNSITYGRLLEVALFLWNRELSCTSLLSTDHYQWEFPEKEKQPQLLHTSDFNTCKVLEMVVHCYLISKGFQHYAQTWGN